VTIGAGETILGSDPNQATWAFSDPAIAPVHARLWIEDGKTYIQDEGSAAGTWVNYILVPEEGIRLRQGDQVHIGGKTFRFKSSNPDDKRKIVILTEEPSP
jgi:predicted component of type VI protein secretion system